MNHPVASLPVLYRHPIAVLHSHPSPYCTYSCSQTTN